MLNLIQHLLQKACYEAFISSSLKTPDQVRGDNNL